MKRALLALALLAAAVVFTLADQLVPESAMSSAANALIASLDDAQRAKIRFPFESEERLNWHFIPRERKGLPLKEMTEPQRQAAFALLRTGLSAKGFTKAESIRSLEHVLRAMEGAAMRDAELYFFTIFGDPGRGSWAWRYEGHHLSQNWTIVNAKPVATTPAFMGANPAEVRADTGGIAKGTVALAAEGALGWSLLNSLSAEQRQAAVVDATAPRDILTGNTRKTTMLDQVGIVASSLSGPQQGMLMSLIEEHAASQSAALAALRLAKVRADGLARIRFAWLGATEPGRGHYYRIQGPSFLIEYDNVQNNANHQHIVWRDFNGDFGVDLIAAHYAGDPHHQR
jgi:hypothetical protein